MKENLGFHDLKAIDNEVKMNPEKRQNKIEQLINKLASQQNVLDELNKWDMEIERNLVRLEGKVLDKVEIIFSGVIFRTIQDFYYQMYIFTFFYIIKEKDKTYNKDWNNKLRSAKHLISYPLNKWALFYGSRDRAEAENLQNLLKRCAINMGITVTDAIMYGDWLIFLNLLFSIYLILIKNNQA
jgi:hypothetical protein